MDDPEESEEEDSGKPRELGLRSRVARLAAEAYEREEEGLKPKEDQGRWKAGRPLSDRSRPGG